MSSQTTVDTLNDLLARIQRNRRDAFGQVPAFSAPTFEDGAETDVVELAAPSYARGLEPLETPTDVVELGAEVERIPDLLETPTDVVELGAEVERIPDPLETPTDVTELDDEGSGAISVARPILTDSSRGDLGEFDFGEASSRVRPDDETDADLRGTAFDDDTEYELPTAPPPSGTSERATWAPSADTEDNGTDVELVALPLDVPAAAASRVVAKDAEHGSLRPVMTLPEFDDAFDVVEYVGELPEVPRETLGDVLDAALSLG